MNLPDPSSHSAAHQHNRQAWNQRAQAQGRFTQAAPDEAFGQSLATIDPAGWLGGSIVGKRLLCLGAGGGRHGPLYAEAQAEVTVVDISAAQLELDRQVASERGLPLRTVEASIDSLSMFGEGAFDIVIQPVSSCYVPDCQKVFREVGRITVTGGLYISQHKQPGSMQADVAPSKSGYELVEPYYRNGPLPAVVGSLHREEGTLEFLHRWEELIGGVCRAGFVVEDLIEPDHADPKSSRGSFGHRSQFVAPYVRIKARRTGQMQRDQRSSDVSAGLWTP